MVVPIGNQRNIKDVLRNGATKLFGIDGLGRAAYRSFSEFLTPDALATGLAAKADRENAYLEGLPRAPTQNSADNSDLIATTAFVKTTVAETTPAFPATEEEVQEGVRADRFVTPAAMNEVTEKADSALQPGDIVGAPLASTGLATVLALSPDDAVVRYPPFYAEADCYGAHGSTAALLGAIQACQDKGCGFVLVSAGEWTISETIEIPSHVKVMGAGIDVTIFKAANGLNAHIFTTPDTETLWATTSEEGAQYWGLSNCTVDGNKANNTAGCGVKTYSRAYVIDNVKIEYCKEKGIQSRWGDSAAYGDDDDRQFDMFMEALINNVFVQYCDEEGIHYDGPHDGRMQNCIVALNSHTSHGTYDGVYFGSRAGGQMATQCHSWGDTQRYAWNIEAQSTHFANCEADAAAVALVRINASDCTWVGGTQIGGWIFTPPSTANKNLKGFIFGPNAYYPYIQCAVRNCPKGVVDFASVGNLGGVIALNGAIEAALQTPNTGETTFGFQGAVPSSFRVNIYCAGVGSNYAVNQMPAPQQFVQGSAAFPSVVGIGGITSGLFFGVNFAALSGGGEEAIRAVRNNCVKFTPRNGTPPTEPWVEGLAYYDNSLHKLRVFDGTAWQNCW